MLNRQRIAITGLGVISPLGLGAEKNWENHLIGRSGIQLLEQPWSQDLSCRIGGIVPPGITEALEPLLQRRLDRCSQLALLAAREAWSQSAQGSGARIAVVVGCGIGGLHTLEHQHTKLLQGGPERLSPLTVPMLIPNAPAAQVAIEIGATSGVHTPVSACASGAEALLWAQLLLDSDRADVVVAGGTEAPVNRMALAAFGAMRALSCSNHHPNRASKPFGQDRDGFVLSEGAGMLVLERENDVRARQGKPLGWLMAAGSSSGGKSMVSPDPGGTHGLEAMHDALHRAGLGVGDLSFIQAHATGTPVGDLAEATALTKLLGQDFADLPVTAPKGQLGHLLGGAGAVETILALQALREGLVPPTLNASPLDPLVSLEVVQEKPLELETTKHSERYALKNAFGFGGHNISLIIGI